jgi:hypothetical protein
MEIRDFEEDKEKDEHSRSGQDEHRGAPACGQAGRYTEEGFLGGIEEHMLIVKKGRKLLPLPSGRGGFCIFSLPNIFFFSVAPGVLCVLCVSLFQRSFSRIRLSLFFPEIPLSSSHEPGKYRHCPKGITCLALLVLTPFFFT